MDKLAVFKYLGVVAPPKNTSPLVTPLTLRHFYGVTSVVILRIACAIALPVIILPWPGPRSGWFNIYSDTSTFSPPLSDLTHEGSPYSLTASQKHERTVLALLLSDAFMYTGSREYPSMPP